MPKKKKLYNLTRKIVTQLRAIHRSWPNANECLKSSKVGKNEYKCCSCRKVFRKEYMRKDHTLPIGEEPELITVGLARNWVPSWDCYINSVFSLVDNYQALCLDCHDVKTAEENRIRKLKKGKK